jgi:hypothetical protein
MGPAILRQHLPDIEAGEIEQVPERVFMFATGESADRGTGLRSGRIGNRSFGRGQIGSLQRDRDCDPGNARDA